MTRCAAAAPSPTATVSPSRRHDRGGAPPLLAPARRDCRDDGRRVAPDRPRGRLERLALGLDRLLLRRVVPPALRVLRGQSRAGTPAGRPRNGLLDPAPGPDAPL